MKMFKFYFFCFIFYSFSLLNAASHELTMVCDELGVNAAFSAHEYWGDSDSTYSFKISKKNKILSRLGLGDWEEWCAPSKFNQGFSYTLEFDQRRLLATCKSVNSISRYTSTINFRELTFKLETFGSWSGRRKERCLLR